MTSSPHDPADCELAVCDRCDAYGNGYSAGKDAAYFAISTWELGAHASDCGCRPCLAIRQAVSKVLLAAVVAIGTHGSAALELPAISMKKQCATCGQPIEAFAREVLGTLVKCPGPHGGPATSRSIL